MPVKAVAEYLREEFVVLFFVTTEDIVFGKVLETVVEEYLRALLAGIAGFGLSCLPWTDQLRKWAARVKSRSLI